jgi:hypothetical protein
MPREKKSILDNHAAKKGGNVSAYPKDKQILWINQ